MGPRPVWTGVENLVPYRDSMVYRKLRVEYWGESGGWGAKSCMGNRIFSLRKSQGRKMGQVSFFRFLLSLHQQNNPSFLTHLITYLFNYLI